MASFCSLPPEIRVQIYRELFHTSKDIEDRIQIINNELDEMFLHKFTTNQPMHLFVPSQQHQITSPILRTSRTIYHEASTTFYEETTFRCCSQLRFIGTLPTFYFANKNIHRFTHVELVLDLTHEKPFPTIASHSVQAFFKALRSFSKRACSLKSLHLDFIGGDAEKLMAIDSDHFGNRIRDFGPKLERISIYIHYAFKASDLEHRVQSWFSRTGWDECDKEELQNLDPINIINIIPEWTFRRR